MDHRIITALHQALDPRDAVALAFGDRAHLLQVKVRGMHPRPFGRQRFQERER